LSAARAAGVAARLAARGGPQLSARLEATGYGESHPVASNANETGRRRNRRVEIRVLLAAAPGEKKYESTAMVKEKE
jgi:outer membrane protein OmpA-like peptidoglycan-associated protein